MTDLSSKARALIRTGRSSFRPRESDRARIESALRERLGPDALTSETLPTTASKMVASWQAASGLALIVGVAGITAFMLLRHTGSNSQPRPQPAPTITRPAPTPSTPPQSQASPPVDRTSVAKVEARDAPHQPHPRDRLSREVALLSRATSALHAGDPSAALRALDEHQRKFPNGMLSEERRAAKALALCSLGRFDEGRSELAHLTPRSPEAARARDLCAPQP
jgi:hypothetical protein